MSNLKLLHGLSRSDPAVPGSDSVCMTDLILSPGRVDGLLGRPDCIRGIRPQGRRRGGNDSRHLSVFACPAFDGGLETAPRLAGDREVPRRNRA